MFYLETHYRRKQPQKLDTVVDNSIGQEGSKAFTQAYRLKV